MSKTVSERFNSAFSKFGLRTNLISESDFLHNYEMDVFSFGRPPIAIDIMTQVKGLNFEKSAQLAERHAIDGIDVKVVHINHLILAKQAARRLKDLNDIQHLEQEE